jgi:sporadic carbohydrate cluster 2OG-Fe(II) oxygenase|tara:strand:- start:2271 stop:3071 length:801 start_codon:yes stop_codon:yes gene_type:complete
VKDINKISEEFINKGYVICKIENKTSYLKIENEIFLIIKKYLKIKKKVEKTSLFNNLHKYLEVKNLNQLRLNIYKELNSKNWFKEAYFKLAAKTIETIVGNELAMQNNINFSIQMPKDNTSKLEMHADSLSGESKFQAVLWVPLMNVYKTKSMYMFSKKFSQKTFKNLKNYKYDGMSDIYKKNFKKKKFLNIKKGEFILFSPNLLHGNVRNDTKETRISMNTRFKNFFSPYGDKKQFGKRMGYFYMPFKIKPATKFALEFDLPNEF